jgi:GAF domain-containing protein
MGTDLNQQLADVARDIQSQDDISDVATRISQAAVEIVGGDAMAGISLVHARRRIETIGATSDLARRGDELQYEKSEGPCLDAVWEQKQVYASRLAGDERWPDWGPAVGEELGVQSMLCTQLFTNEDQLGALNIYSRRPDAFDEDDRSDVELLSAHAAVAVAAAQQIEGLKFAADRRTLIGKAIGIVMERFQVDDDTAFGLLRRLSQEQNRKLYDLATQLVQVGQLPTTKDASQN